MKIKLYLISSAAVLLAGCHDYKADIAALNKEKEALIANEHYKDSTINAFLEGLNQIENNINAITEKQAEVADMSSQSELSQNQFERINEDIQSINALMDANKNKLDELNKKFKGSNIKIKQLEKTLASLQQQLEEKNTELAALNQKLADMNITIENLNTNVKTLTAQTEDQAKTIADRTTRLNTAYFTVGTYKELETKKVLNKTGGFLGIGKNKQMVNDFKPDAFTSIDVTQTKTIELNSKKASLVTTHPSSSYKLEKKDKNLVTQLVITDPDQFWKASKYLVVMVEK